MNRQERNAVRKSLNVSIRDGIAAAATSGFGNNYVNPFAVALGGTNIQIGVLNSIIHFIPSLMQLKAADITEYFGSRKKIIVISVLLQASMLIPMAFIPFFPKHFRIIALICFCTFYMSFESLATPAWGSLMANLVPKKRMGRYFSRRSRIVSLVTLVTTFLAGFLLDVFNNPSLTGFTIIFLLAMVSRYISCYFLSRMYEPPLEIKREHYFSFVDFLKRLNIGNFGKYVIFQSSFNLSVHIASPFFAVYMLRNLGFSYLTYTIVITVVPLSAILSMSYWGRHADTAGNRKVLTLCSFIISSLPAWWLISQDVFFLIGVQALSGFFWGGFNLCSSNFIYESAIPEKRTRCISYFNTINGFAICLGNLLGGFLAVHLPPVFGHRLLAVFAISAFLRFLAAVILLRRVKAAGKGV